MPTQTLEHTTKNSSGQENREAGKRTKTNRGNFANNPDRAREAGRKGGKARGKPRP